MKVIPGWTRLEFGKIAKQTAAKPLGAQSLRCVELEHVQPETGRLLGWRNGSSNEGSKVLFARNSLLFGKLRPYLKKAWFSTFDGMCSSEFWVLEPEADRCDVRWLKQLVLSELFAKATYASSGSKMPRADWSVVGEHPFDLPPLSEQRKIADILSTWDEALETLDALTAAKDRQKKALMQQLLTGKTRVKGAKGRWNTHCLSEMLVPITRTVPKPAGKFLAAGIRSHGKGVFLKPDFSPEDIALDELFEIKAGDLIVNITFAWEGAAAIVSEQADGALVSHRFPTFLFKDRVASCSFFRHYIRSKRFVFDCGLASPGGAGRNRVLSKSAFLDIELKAPSFDEQEQIGAILDTADHELTLLHAQRQNLDQQKRGLMQRLLTGKIRVTPTPESNV